MRSPAYRVDGLDLDVLPRRNGRPRLVVGAGGPRMLRIAARHADTVGLLPAPIKGAEDTDDPADRGPAALAAKIDVLRAAAGDRFPRLELSAFGTFIVTSRRRASTEELIASRGWAGTSVETVWEMPTLFVGSAAQIREDLRARRDRFGLSYLIAPDRDLPVLAEVIGGL